MKITEARAFINQSQRFLPQTSFMKIDVIDSDRVALLTFSVVWSGFPSPLLMFVCTDLWGELEGKKLLISNF